MHKTYKEKIRDYFINLGKHHRILLPVAVIGLAVTMLIIRLADYCKHGAKRFACILFVVCLFFMGNSFAFPYFNLDNGFVSEKSEPKMIAAQDSVMVLAKENSVAEGENLPGTENGADIDISEISTDSEYGNVVGNDVVSLEDILQNQENLGDLEKNETVEETQSVNFDKTDWRLILINKQHPISESYEFTLGNLSGSMQCDERIIEDLLLMMKAADKDGVKLVICSPYRDLAKQEKLFERKINAYIKAGYSYIDAYKLSSQAVTIPGASEHQVGLAVDLITPNYTVLDEGFENTDAGIWLKNHCAEYGFTLRYPKNKEYITSIEYEPWHFRYVGKEAASIMMNENLCLEEFWDIYM